MAGPNPIELQKALSGMDYPTDKKSLVERARSNHADGKLVEKLESLRQDSFDGPNEVQKAVFKG
ncbi:DUF2795 domain-containing protein [Streptomyces sp. UH6]|uniref:DUF2795 domain-containing protein n=1 Tax=Streptomyces sp. UH6 TaxID=2748379 RepID=UPI0015D4C8C3|nr:DUF2795 domain-containing protein [Streptomyces sp. UH6]NYV76300.1 DUF2795 domain-containing protein [Streptomyces sp. UH6]